jgi:hypothetical protein
MIFHSPFPLGPGFSFPFLFFIASTQVCSILVASDKLLFLIHSIGQWCEPFLSSIPSFLSTSYLFFFFLSLV